MGFPERAGVGLGFLAFCYVVFMFGFVGHFGSRDTLGPALIAYVLVFFVVWLPLRAVWFIFRFGE